MKTYNYIYLIRNLINNKIYIGKHSTNILQDGYMGSGVYLKKAIKKYGIENFKKTLLCLCDEDDLNEMEKLYIKVYGSTNPNLGYNLTFGGDGVIPTDEARRKKSESLKGRVFSDETLRKFAESHKGKHHSYETKQKMSEAKKGKQNAKGKHWNLTEETKQKMSKPKKKFKWKTPDGEIVEMATSHVKRYHPDWILLNE